MKAKIVLFFLIFLGSSHLLFSNEPQPVPSSTPPLLSKLIINGNDSILFDLANATITATYLDLPVYATSDDFIIAVDYALRFNTAKLTYSSNIDMTTDPTFQFFAYYNQSDLTLRFTSSSLQNVVMGAPIVKIRFTLTSPCVPITDADFTYYEAYLNGDFCSYGMKNAGTVISNPIPVANFNHGPGCLNSNTPFTDISTIAGGSITGWQWNFSNGSSATQQNPSSAYTTTGTAAATLIVTSSLGCMDTVVKTFTVNETPTSSFSYSFDCIKDSVLFTNTSAIPSGSITSSLWDFGDLGSSTLSNPAHHYNASGIYTVSLVSTSNFSCSATGTLAVNLTNKVNAIFTFTSGNNCLGSATSFTDGSTYTNPITGWSWDFGDGGTSTQQNPSHTYTASGTYSITLTSTSTDGCKGTITKTVTINALPNIQFTASTVTACANAAVSFTDLSTAAPGSTYLWHFGDGNTSAAQNPSYSYTAGGSYSVKLVVQTPGGCTDSLTKPSYITVNDSPVAGFSLSGTCVMSNIRFTDNSSIATGSVVSWSWDFGDSHTSTLQNPNNTYSVTGSYTVSLTSTSDLGCSGSTTQTIIISNKPTANFAYTTGTLDCSGQSLVFSNLSTPASGPTYFWSFGDGGSSVLQNPVHTFSANGFYGIKLVVANPGGCADSLIKPYNPLLPTPATALFKDTVVSNAVVSFSNQSTNSIKVAWDFGDGQTSVIDNPIHTFPNIGTYKVCLTAYNTLSCTSSYCRDINVVLSSIVAVPSSFTPNQDDVNDVLKVRGGPLVEMEFKIFNEWGNLLFTSPAQNIGWDGSFNGEPQPVGVYEYVLKGKTAENKRINLYGVINLTR